MFHRPLAALRRLSRRPSPSFSGGRAALALSCLLAALVGATAHAAPEQRLETERFIFRYDPDRLDITTVQAAREAADRAWEHCRRLFGRAPGNRIECDLTPTRFLGATGFAVPDARRPRIAVRFPDLDYLGLRGAYVLAHEIAHIFSGRDAGGPLGEGLADFAANDFAEIPLQPWWAGELRRRGLWVDPDALFITGDYPANTELDARIRIARYTEPALLVQFLVGEYGMERVLRFIPVYTKARPSLASNEEGGGRQRRGDPAAARASFRLAFGLSWEEIRRRWEQTFESPPPSVTVAERMVLGQQIYATIRDYEMWLLRARISPPAAETSAIRRAFEEANRALAAARLADARIHFADARRRVDALRRPVLSAHAKLPQPAAPHGSLIFKYKLSVASGEQNR